MYTQIVCLTLNVRKWFTKAGQAKNVPLYRLIKMYNYCYAPCHLIPFWKSNSSLRHILGFKMFLCNRWCCEIVVKRTWSRLSHLAQRATETKHPSNSESWCIISRSSLPTEQLHNWLLILLSEVLLPSVITDRIEAFITKSKAKITFERSCDVNILCHWKTFLDCVELIHVTLNAVYTLVLFNV